MTNKVRANATSIKNISENIIQLIFPEVSRVEMPLTRLSTKKFFGDLWHDVILMYGD